MGIRRQSYAAYSVGCGIVWAAILGVLARRGEKERLTKVLPFFGGWWMGWASSTIARSVYPPPPKSPHKNGAA